MTTDSLHFDTADHRGLANALAPALRETCSGRLGALSWFKADWQRGGAATATSTWRDDSDRDVPVVVKLPVVRRELVWLRRLQPAAGDEPSPAIPRLYASGEAIDDYDLTWVVMERFAHGPLGLKWHADHVKRVAEATTRFHERAAAYQVDEPPRREPWDEMLDESIESIRINRVADDGRWLEAIKSLRSRLDPIVLEWRSRDVRQWLHGDLHLANAMSRESLEHGPVGLIDLAEVHAGHWLEDAVYLERQLWARPARLAASKPVKLIASARRKLGLPVEEGYPRLAMIRRALLAATAPKFIRSEGHPRHMEACLDWLEKAVAELR